MNKHDDLFKAVSGKVDHLILDCLKEPPPKTDRKLVLPKSHYGPFCNKVLKDFIEKHKLDDTLPLPGEGDNAVSALSKIFDLIVHSLGERKRQEILKELDEYVMGIPAQLR